VVNLQNNWLGSGNDGRSVVQSGQFIGGAGSTFVKYGVGKWTLTGSNNLLGNTDIEGGIISIDSLSKIGAGYLGMAGGTLQYTGTNDATKNSIFYSDRNSFSAFDIVNAGVNFTLNSTNAASWKINSLRKDGQGTLTLSGVGWGGGAAVDVNSGFLVTTAALSQSRKVPPSPSAGRRRSAPSPTEERTPSSSPTRERTRGWYRPG
jgi:autotransporter-associated beta strand protein